MRRASSQTTTIMARGVVKTVLALSETASELIAIIVVGVGPMLFLFAYAIGILATMGILMILLRRVLILFAPDISRNAKLFAALTNEFLKTFAIIIDAFEIAIIAIKDALAFFSGQHAKPFPSLYWPHKVSPSDVIRFSNTVGTVCPTMDNAFSIIGFLLKQGMHDVVCPVLRASHPLTLIGGVGAYFLSFLSYGYEPYPDGDNCVIHEDIHPKVTCVLLGTGIIIVEIVLPLLVGCIFLINAGPTTFRVGVYSLTLVLALQRRIKSAGERLVVLVDETLGRLLD